jgi:hypothetical protein
MPFRTNAVSNKGRFEQRPFRTNPLSKQCPYVSIEKLLTLMSGWPKSEATLSVMSTDTRPWSTTMLPKSPTWRTALLGLP